MELTEKTIDSREVFKGRIIRVRFDTVRLPNGKEGTREVVEHPGGVAILAIDSEDRVLLVRQYRYPYAETTLEIPAGKMDRGPENAEEAGRRELSEETGYQADKYTYLTKLATTVGFSNEFIYIYAAEGLTPGEQHPDEDEFINVCTLTMEEAMEKIRSGEICDAKSITAVLLWREMQKK